ncbi:MAG: radical SAM protein [Candidatus Nealsonbacteria bacterium]|nr:radical SAM protein [Candidatus Nealsonbacteria bacterium]
MERDGNRIVGRVECPNGERTVILSSNAEVFLSLREKAMRVDAWGRSRRLRPLVNLLSITNQCNFRCPVCYAASGPSDNPSHLALTEIVRRACDMRRVGVKQVSLTGGEPTLHPDLPRIVRRLRRMGLRVLIATNGQRLAESPEYARFLKRCGLWKVNLQLDTLDESVHEKLRGNRLVEAKVRAVRNVVAARLRLGTITAVTTLNLPDVGRIVKFGLSLTPAPMSIVFQAASTAGRYSLAENTVVDREQIIGELLRCENLHGTTLDDVWPLPSYRPWALRVHPDCAANIVLLRDGPRVTPLTRAVDVDKLYRKLGQNAMSANWITRNLVPAAYAVAAIRYGNAMPLLKSMMGLLAKARRSGIVLIGVGSFLSEAFWDERRIADCATVEWTDTGPVSPCVYYSPMKSHLGQLVGTSESVEPEHELTTKGGML